MPTALVIGASRGIGREFTRQLLAARWQVFATARDDASLKALQDEGAAAHRLDVTRPEQLAALGWQLDGVKLDLAVYVAGVVGPQQGATESPAATDFDQVMHANVLGAMQAIPVVAPLVEAGRGKFAFISSGMGSIGEAQSSAAWLYRTSKAALNMAVRTAAYDYPRAVFVAICPGWVRTDMGGPKASTPVEKSVAGMLRLIGGLAAPDSGSFRDYNGRYLQW